MENTVAATAVFAWAPFGCLVVGTLYVISSNRNASLGRRLIAASYAPLAAFIYLGTAIWAPVLQRNPSLLLYIATLVPSLAMLLVSLRWFPGPRWVHAVLVPVALAYMPWQFVLGYFGVFGK